MSTRLLLRIIIMIIVSAGVSRRFSPDKRLFGLPAQGVLKAGCDLL